VSSLSSSACNEAISSGHTRKPSNVAGPTHVDRGGECVALRAAEPIFFQRAVFAGLHRGSCWHVCLIGVADSSRARIREQLELA
jgi:hypothetical protein